MIDAILDGDPRLIDVEVERHTAWSAAELLDMLAERRKGAAKSNTA
ncbi:hypothetical protein ACWD4G_16790 [Streptomyces sp. NPDC002643]